MGRPNFIEFRGKLKLPRRQNYNFTFERLKTAASAVPSLKIPDPNKAFMLETDASGIAVGAVLKQTGEERKYPVLFYSQGLTMSVRNYSTYESEFLAVVKACEAFKVFY